MKSFNEWKLEESVDASRYSISVNYRTNPEEVLDAYSKISLGYISAAMKNYGFHTKHVFTEQPYRLIVASRNWDDGEWVGLVSWDHKNKCFVISRGFYNKANKTASIIKTEKCAGTTASEVSKELYKLLQDFKEQPDRFKEKLKPVSLKRGPKS
jgi:hypothetical protein